jgi:hypothetical protein
MMVELKDYFQGIMERKEKVLLWIPGADDEPVAMSTYISDVFLYEGKLSGLGCTPDPTVGYVEFVPMDQVIKFTIIPDELIQDYFDRIQPAPAGSTDIKQ